MHLKMSNLGAFPSFISHQCLTRISLQQCSDMHTNDGSCFNQMGRWHHVSLSHWKERPVCFYRVNTNRLAMCWHPCRVAALVASFRHNCLDLNVVAADLQHDLEHYYLSSLCIRICPVLERLILLFNLWTNSPKQCKAPFIWQLLVWG